MVGEIRKMEIWRFALAKHGENEVEVPMGTKLMAVGMHESHVCMYGMVDALAPLGKCKVHVVGLKEELPKKALHLIGMVKEKDEVPRTTRSAWEHAESPQGSERGMKDEGKINMDNMDGNGPRGARGEAAEMGHDKEGKMIKFGPAQEDHGQDAHATLEELFVFLEVEMVPQGKRIIMPEGPVRH
jgi:hypothetical protein